MDSKDLKFQDENIDEDLSILLKLRAINTAEKRRGAWNRENAVGGGQCKGWTVEVSPRKVTVPVSNVCWERCRRWFDQQRVVIFQMRFLWEGDLPLPLGCTGYK